MRDMPTVVSPLFAGRGTELRLLAESYEQAAGGTARPVLIGAEAGGGKSRLIHEFAGQLGNRALVLSGRCAQQDEASQPYAPFTAILRELVRHRGIDDVSALIGAAPELAWVLPESGPLPAATDSDLARARLFETLRLLFELLAAERPLVLVVEDVHWADHGTRDLLSYLAANLRYSALLLVVSYRAEEVTGSLRSFLVELGRIDGVVSLTLPRLSRAEVADQLAGILGEPPSPALARAVHEQGDGVPLFTESLVTADGEIRPGSLREVLLLTVGELPEDTQRVLRVAAVGGVRVGHSLLESLIGPWPPASALLTREEGGYEFRHSMIREAIRDDLSAGERRDIHRRYGEAIQADPALGDGTWTSVALALHWRGAGDLPKALNAAWDAAVEAGQRMAYPEQLSMLGLVLDLWKNVPEATTRTGVRHEEVLDLAVEAASRAAESERGLDLVTEALGTAQGERRAALLLQRATLRRRHRYPGDTDDMRAALELAPNPNRLRAETLGRLSRTLLLSERHAEAEPLARELADLAERLDDEEHRTEGRIVLAALAARAGQDTRDEFVAALETARRIGSGRLEVFGYAALSRALEDEGDSDAAIEYARAGQARAVETGQTRYLGATLAQNLAQALTSAGRWDEALTVVSEALRLYPGPLGTGQLLACAGEITIARGDRPAADRILRGLDALPDDPALSGQVARLRIEHDGAGEFPTRIDWPLLATAAKHHIRIAADLARISPVDHAYGLVVDAERSDETDAWDAAADAWAKLARPYPQASALIRAAGSALRSDDRKGAARRLREAAEIATNLKAAPLLKQITDLTTTRTIASYEGSASDYAAVVGPAPTPFIEAALRRLVDAIGPGGTVLEVGSGTGRDADFVESLGPRVRRTDATQAFLDLQAARGKHVELLDLLTDDLGGLYDAVLAIAVLIHIPRDQTQPLLDRIAGALRPGGAFLVSIREGEGETIDDYHTVFWHRDDFAERLLASGLEVAWDSADIGRNDNLWLTFLALKPGGR